MKTKQTFFYGKLFQPLIVTYTNHSKVIQNNKIKKLLKIIRLQVLQVTTYNPV